MSLLQMSFLGTVIILLIVVLRAVLISRLPKKTFLILWWIALIRLLVPFSIKSVTSIYSLLQSIYSDINPVRTAQTTTFLPIHGNMPEIANGLSEAMVQRTESISILSVIWLAGLLLCFGFFAVSYIKCYREFRFSLPVENDILEAFLEKQKVFDLRPAAIIKNLQLRQPIYQQTAAYGHFGRTDIDLPWERLDKVDIIKKEAGL